MQGYYNTPAMPGMGPGGMMDPRVQQQIAMQQQQQGGMMGMQPGIGMGMGPGMGAGMGMNGTPGMGGMSGMGGMQGMGGMGGQAWRNLGYDYQLPATGYTPDSSWSAWDLAHARYNGDRMERGFLDNIISTLATFFSARHLSEDSARTAHRRVYHSLEGEDAGNRTLGGAAAYQAYLAWDRDHYSAYHSYPTTENRERLVALAVAELFALWEKLNPRSSRANVEEAAQYAAATAKYLFDRHYDLTGGHSHHPHNRSSRYSGYGADDDSDSGSEGRHRRRRSQYNQGPGYGQMGPGAGMGMMPGAGGMMGPQAGMGMQQPGYGSMGMPGALQNGMGMGGAGMHGMGMGIPPGVVNPMMMQNMMGGGGGMMPGMGGGGGMAGGMGGGIMYPGGYGNPNNEAQAAPGMHPYHYGSQSGVAYGSQAIDQMGNPTFPGGPGRSWYGYGQPRGY